MNTLLQNQRNEILYAVVTAFQNCQESETVIINTLADLCTYFQANHIYITPQFEDNLYEYTNLENQQPLQLEHSIHYPLRSNDFIGCLHIDFSETPNIDADEYAWLKTISSLLIALLNKIRDSKKIPSEASIIQSLQHIATEIKNPLSSVISFSELLAITDDSDERQAYLKIINVYNLQLTRLINNIFDFHKLESNEVTFHVNEHDLNQIFNHIEENTNHRLDDTDITLHLEKKWEKCEIQIDENRLSQIIYNAIDYFISSIHKGKVKLSYNLSETFDIYIEMSTSDSNIQDIDCLFKNKSNHLNDISRIRLITCKQLTKLMQGTFSYKIENNTLLFSLQFDKSIVNAPKKASSNDSSKQKTTILIAEDNEFNFKLIDIILRGENIIHAWNGEEAVKLFKEIKPELVLMDLKMPIMDGYQATSLIRQMSPSVPIIAITAFTDDQQLVMNSGFSSYISKPIDTKILFREINHLLVR